MGDNYFTKTSDVLTDAFDVLGTEHKNGRLDFEQAEIEKIVSVYRKEVDDIFRRQYSICKKRLEHYVQQCVEKDAKVE